jgi:hypothetical protein
MRLKPTEGSAPADLTLASHSCLCFWSKLARAQFCFDPLNPLMYLRTPLLASDGFDILGRRAESVPNDTHGGD